MWRGNIYESGFEDITPPRVKQDQIVALLAHYKYMDPKTMTIVDRFAYWAAISKARMLERGRRIVTTNRYKARRFVPVNFGAHTLPRIEQAEVAELLSLVNEPYQSDIERFAVLGAIIKARQIVNNNKRYNKRLYQHSHYD